MIKSKSVLMELAKKASAYTSDSRRVTAQTIFVALKGEKTDGHKFVPELLERGCLLAIVSQDWLAQNSHYQNRGDVLAVPSTNEAHRLLAAVFRKKFQGKIIGVGGSSGKTSTKDFLSHLLSGAFKVFKTEKSQNGELGIPKTLEGLHSGFDLAVIEIGIDAPGDMRRHVEIVEPDVALLTSIGEEHLNLLKNIENVFHNAVYFI